MFIELNCKNQECDHAWESHETDPRFDPVCYENGCECSWFEKSEAERFIDQCDHVKLHSKMWFASAEPVTEKTIMAAGQYLSQSGRKEVN